jgi:hypothetical protein
LAGHGPPPPEPLDELLPPELEPLLLPPLLPEPPPELLLDPPLELVDPLPELPPEPPEPDPLSVPPSPIPCENVVPPHAHIAATAARAISFERMTQTSGRG